MPWGLVVIGALSLIVYRRAHGVGRSPFPQVFLLWGASFVGFMVGSVPGYIVRAAGGPFEMIPIMAISGALIGACWAIRRAGQPKSSKVDQEKSTQ